MKEQLPIQRTVYNKELYNKVIDTSFKEFTTDTSATDQFRTVQYFFQLYEDLFYEIPAAGSVNSHEYLIQKSTDFVGVETRSSDVDALIEEINDLRKQLLDAQKQLIESQTPTT